MNKVVAILGSSGGNLYNLGGKDPRTLLGEMILQISHAGIEVGAIQFIAAETSMDHVKPTTHASLWVWDGAAPSIVFQGTLEEVNQRAAEEDKKIA